MTYPSYPQHPENDDGGYASAQYQQQYAGTQAPGKLDIGRALSFGFIATFNNARVWITFGVVAFLAMVAYFAFAFVKTMNEIEKNGAATYNSSQAGPNLATMIIVGLITAAIGVWVAKAALSQIDAGRVQFDRVFNGHRFLPAFGVALIFQVISVCYQLIQNSVRDGNPGAALLINFGWLLVVFFVLPLVQFVAYYVVDSEDSIGTCLSRCFNDAKRNYGLLLLLNLIVGAIVFISVLAFFIGLIITLPALALISAFAYRQVSGDALPQQAPQQYMQ